MAVAVLFSFGFAMFSTGALQDGGRSTTMDSQEAQIERFDDQLDAAAAAIESGAENKRNRQIANPALYTQADVCTWLEAALNHVARDPDDNVELRAIEDAGLDSEARFEIAFVQDRSDFQGAWGACTTVSKDRFPIDIEEILISPDGSLAAVWGGWMAAPLLGKGGVCYFRRATVQWRRIGCLTTWIS